MIEEDARSYDARMVKEWRQRQVAYMRTIRERCDAVDLVRRLTYHAECFTPDEVESIILSETS